jgi:predicted nucleotidyltransferase
MIDIEVPTFLSDDRQASTARAPVQAFVAAAAKRFPVKRAVLFGSRARGDGRPDSDTDVALILAEPPGAFMDTKLALADLAFDVMLETGVLIQAWPIWESQWEAPQTHANPSLVRNIRREGIAL